MENRISINDYHHDNAVVHERKKKKSYFINIDGNWYLSGTTDENHGYKGIEGQGKTDVVIRCHLIFMNHGVYT